MTDFDALDSVYPLPFDDLPRQWALSLDRSSHPPEWGQSTLRGWSLSAHPSAHVCRLECQGGDHVGWILEPLLHTGQSGSVSPTTALTLERSSGDKITEADVEKSLYGRDAYGHSDGTGLEGMWIAIILTDQFKRVYLGPIHSVMFDPQRRKVATSHNLLQPFSRDLELSRAFDPLATGRYFSFGLTAFQKASSASSQTISSTSALLSWSDIGQGRPLRQSAE